jgi:hypothetical protein
VNAVPLAMNCPYGSVSSVVERIPSGSSRWRCAHVSRSRPSPASTRFIDAAVASTFALRYSQRVPGLTSGGASSASAYVSKPSK